MFFVSFAVSLPSGCVASVGLQAVMNAAAANTPAILKLSLGVFNRMLLSLIIDCLSIDLSVLDSFLGLCLIGCIRALDSVNRADYHSIDHLITVYSLLDAALWMMRDMLAAHPSNA